MGDGIGFSTEVGRGVTTFQAYPEEILLDPELNGRHEETSVEELAADIEVNGQSTPVVCRKDDEGNPVLVFGHRRYRAVHLLNERNPKAKRKLNFIYRRYNADEAFQAAISENRFRKDVSPIDDATNIEILQRRFGKTIEDIAKIYFPEAKTVEALKTAAKWVKDRLSLVELVSEAQQAVREGRMKVTAAVGLAKLNRAQQKVRVAKQGKIKVADVSSKPAKKTAKKSKKAPAAMDSKLRAMIKLVTDSADFESYDEASHKFIEVDALALVALKNYIEEK